MTENDARQYQTWPRHLFTLYNNDRQDVDTPPDYNTVLDREKADEDLPTYEEVVKGLGMTSGNVGNSNDLEKFELSAMNMNMNSKL